MQKPAKKYVRNARTKQGFTLIELLVVLAIIGLLTSLVVPVVSKALASAHTAKCLSNLRQMGLAATLYSFDYNERLVPMYVESAESVASRRIWRGLLLSYLANDPKIFICPSDRFELSRTVGDATARVGLQPTSYGINNVTGLHDYGSYTPGRKMFDVSDPTNTVFITDIGTPDNVSSALSKWTEKGRRPTQASFGYARMPNGWRSGDYSVYPRHRQAKCNVLFYDGHVATLDIANDLVGHPPGDPQCLYDNE